MDERLLAWHSTGPEDGSVLRIQVAASTRDLLGDRLPLEARDVEVKGLGHLKTFLVEA